MGKIGSNIAKLPLFISCFLLLMSWQVRANTLRVPSQHPTIQQAINAAQNGDTVLVAPGTYFENINFNGKAITVTSESGPQVTIIDGNHLDSVVTFESEEGLSSVLNGLTIKNGSLPSGSSRQGGGINIFLSSPTITNNIITQNTVCAGGAGIGIISGSPLIQNNLITDNAEAGCIGPAGAGGIFIHGLSTAKILSNTISNNRFNLSGGGIALFNFVGSQVTVRNNVIKGNNAGIGGGIFCTGGSFNVGGVPTIIAQNLIINNSAVVQGGGIYIGTEGDVIVNNTIVNNGSLQGSGIYAASAFNSVIINNIIVGRSGSSAISVQIVLDLFPIIVKSNNVYTPNGWAYDPNGQLPDQTGMNGNISTDPLFNNPAAENYHLQSSSPSIDTGDNAALNLPPIDLDGNPRIFDGDHNGSAIVDMGVYEFGSTAFDLCIQDESSNDVLRINSTTGAYQLIRCRDGFTIGSTGTLTRRGCTITLQDFRSDRRVMASIDTCSNRASAAVQIFAQRGSFTLTDRNTMNNTCVCPNGN